MKMKALAGRISKKRIVTEGRGSWEWQDAFRVATYVATLMDDGRILWKAAYHGPKLSAPQMYHNIAKGGRLMAEWGMGSLHNAPVPFSYAVACIGKRATSRIEQHGWKFHRPPELAT
jgi:hypothetical protein